MNVKVNLLRAEMAKAGVTQTKLAEMLGVTPQNLSKKFKRGVFKTNEAEKIIEVLDIKNPTEIFFASN
jgi:transcriptional regulator